jgi:hypothetical protein
MIDIHTYKFNMVNIIFNIEDCKHSILVNKSKTFVKLNVNDVYDIKNNPDGITDKNIKMKLTILLSISLFNSHLYTIISLPLNSSHLLFKRGNKMKSKHLKEHKNPVQIKYQTSELMDNFVLINIMKCAFNW